MIKAVVFDLDGTLTRPFLSFSQIRQEIGVSEGKLSLLEQITLMPEAEKRRALEILNRHERAAVENAELNPGAAELMDFLRGRGIRSAVVTRNSDQSTFQVLAKLGLTVQRVITRDSGLPLKPDPAPLIHLAREWGLNPDEILMVGDYRYDLEAGRAAGTLTCLVTNGRELDYRDRADVCVNTPGELIRVFETMSKELGRLSPESANLGVDS